MLKYIYFLLITLSGLFIISCRTNKLIPKADTTITLDCNDTTNYEYVVLKSNRPYDEEIVSQKVNLQISSIDIKEEKGNYKVSVIVHPLDSSMNFITDIDENAWNRRWCKIIDSSAVKVITPKYKVTEVTEDMREPIAFVLVLDHSGSIGDSRAYTIQKAVYNFIDTVKKPEDWVGIVKFDTQINNECKLSNDKRVLLSDLKINGIDEYGGGTALLDAVGKGLEILTSDSLKDFKVKALVLMTDGLENSSDIYDGKSDTLRSIADDNDIAICTIGFSYHYDKKLLADTLSQGTGGSYHHICKQKDFDYVFQDVYKRLKNYYKIEYEIPAYQGLHYVKLVPCDSLSSLSENTYIIPGNEIKKKLKYTVYFNNDESTFNEDDYNEVIDEVVSILRNDSTATVILHGHTDAYGTPEYNYQLGYSRANFVKHQIMLDTIPLSRIQVKSHGFALPAAENRTPEGRQKNRRVEIEVFVKDEDTHFRSPDQTVVK
jgi:outer membrane protein OmpA-like peptidoglycan-associated protein/uncharacterized protein YegL